MDDPIDRGSRGHRALKDLVPLGEHDVAGDDERAPLVTLGDQCEQHLGFVGVLLDVAQIVKDLELEGVPLPERPGEYEVALRREQILDELAGGRYNSLGGACRRLEKMPHKETKTIEQMAIRLTGDSGDGVQLTGTQFTESTAAEYLASAESLTKRTGQPFQVAEIRGRIDRMLSEEG